MMHKAFVWNNVPFIIEHYDDVIMVVIASLITSLTIVYSTVYSYADQRKHQSSASLAFVWGIHQGPVNSPHRCPVTQKMFLFDDIMIRLTFIGSSNKVNLQHNSHNTPVPYPAMHQSHSHNAPFCNRKVQMCALVTGGFSSQSASNVESISMSWLHHDDKF